MLNKCLADADTADHNLNLLQIRGRARGPWLLPILSPCRGIRLPNLRVRTQAADQVPASAPELPSRYPSNVEAASSFLPCADSRSHSWGRPFLFNPEEALVASSPRTTPWTTSSGISLSA